MLVKMFTFCLWGGEQKDTKESEVVGLREEVKVELIIGLFANGSYEPNDKVD